MYKIFNPPRRARACNLASDVQNDKVARLTLCTAAESEECSEQNITDSETENELKTYTNIHPPRQARNLASDVQY